MMDTLISNLNELKLLLQKLQNSDYIKPLNVFHGSTIGQHYRHLVEFYNCALQSPIHSVNYDCRERNLQLENDAQYCQDQINDLISRISLIEDKDYEVTVVSDFGDFKSSFQRELLYVLEHSIHHQALIKIGLIELKLEELISTDFGVAPSTTKYRNQCAH